MRRLVIALIAIGLCACAAGPPNIRAVGAAEPDAVAYRIVFSDMWHPLYDVAAIREGAHARLEWGRRTQPNWEWLRTSRSLTDLEWEDLASCWDWDTSFWSMKSPERSAAIDGSTIEVEATKNGRYHAFSVYAPQGTGAVGRLFQCTSRMLRAAGLVPAERFLMPDVANCSYRHGGPGPGDESAATDPEEDLACAGEPSLLQWSKERPNVSALRVVVAVGSGLHVIVREVHDGATTHLYATTSGTDDQLPFAMARSIDEQAWTSSAECWQRLESEPDLWSPSPPPAGKETDRPSRLALSVEIMHGGQLRSVTQLSRGDLPQIDGRLVRCAEQTLATAGIKIAALSLPPQPLILCPEGSRWDGKHCWGDRVDCPAGSRWGFAAGCVPQAASPAVGSRDDRACPAGTAALPGGTYRMGARGDVVTVKPFCIDRVEVTADAYAACVREGRCEADGLHCGGAATYDVIGMGRHPINCVSWEQASNYCAVQGLRLPTEEEWEWAARGGRFARTYPWGDDPPDYTRPCWSAAARRAGTCAVGSLTSGDAPGEIHDLAGNVVEWTSTEAGGDLRIQRGGGWATVSEHYLRAATRPASPSTAQMEIVGFRCAR
ncbi:MAG TPA: SUMF1/EgtB/PvdO family nonheme iron enzyme [Polyangiaceae bacterium]|jgi:hypothetical protein